ncbi:hypothetical protein E2C01_097139 [Portunus trituberculatus]|uniref:Uncharacterized protein n=1 Tax=Portunus trituberculatus TaxID=210409 RepID=A0A5B7KAF1_PORTR|nr:hypothetical protein [Portunus trituberculatus]
MLEETECLMNLKNQQAYSTSELMQLKNHSQVASKEIEYQEQLSKDLGNQYCLLTSFQCPNQESLPCSSLHFQLLDTKLLGHLLTCHPILPSYARLMSQHSMTLWSEDAQQPFM